MRLTPRETNRQELPQPVGSLVLVNDTVAVLDVSLELSEGLLTIKVNTITLGAPSPEATPPGKKVWEIK